MASTKSKAATQSTNVDTTQAVDQFMAELDHPFKKEIQLTRSAILATDSSIQEGIKWKAPSFRTTEYFATTNLRSQNGVSLILHLGAKVRELPEGGLRLDDPAGLLKWLGEDRAMIELGKGPELQRKLPALQALLRQWIRYVR